jgi:2-keto-3-deoxy-L-rhamnonate aldolase RhmA
VANKFREALLKNELSIGTWIQVGHPAIAEILARVGYNWICVDLEHGSIDIESMTNLFRAIEANNAVAVARLPLNDPIWIRRSLDAGARGLILPMINSAEEIESAIHHAKYPPKGERGFGYSRANYFGMDFEGYIAQANETIAIIAQIEHKEAINNLDAILQVPDLDAVFIGPLDLSGSYGKVGQLDSPEMRDALKRYLESCKKHKKCAGIHIVHPDEVSIRQAIDQGYKMLSLGVDGIFLGNAAASALKAAQIVIPVPSKTGGIQKKQ